MTRCSFFVRSLLACLVMVGIVGSTRADFEVQFTYNGATITLDQTTGVTTAQNGASLSGAVIDYSTPGSISVLNLTVSNTGTTGGFKISATIAESNSPGGPAIATIDTQGLVVQNQNAGKGNGTLTITSGDTGFTSPTGPTGTLVSSISATAGGLNKGAANTVVFSSYLDTTNAQFGTQQGGTPSIVLANVPNGQSASGNASYNVTPTPVPYSLTSVAQITLANGDKFTDLSSATTLVSPAPHASVLLLAGLPALGLGVWIRRRQAIRVAV